MLVIKLFIYCNSWGSLLFVHFDPAIIIDFVVLEMEKKLQ